MITLIIAVDEKYGFSYKGKIPWRCDEDLQRFKALTDKNIVVMGRKTWESIPQRLFTSNKKCVVVTKDIRYKTSYDIEVVNDLSKFKDLCKFKDTHYFLIGGKELIMELKDFIDEIHLTIIKGEYISDILFHEIKDIISSFTMKSCIETDNCFYYSYSH
jgi:dihydrofolate reductase